MSTPINKNCNRIIECPARICLPVSVAPFVVQGATTTTCNGQPTITMGTPCPGIENGTCAFTVTQNITVSIPIGLGAETDLGAPHVQCLIRPTTDNPDPCCNDNIHHRESGQLKDMLI